MSASDIYRQRALELCQRANAQSNFDIRTEYESLAFAYMCLAEQIENDLLEWASVDAAKDLDLNRPPRVNRPGMSS
jgi:hypothetical protein